MTKMTAKKTTKKTAWKKFAERFDPPLLTFTELRAITVTTFNPPKNPLTILANPNARRSLFTLERLFLGQAYPQL